MNNLKESKREPSPPSRLHYSVGDNTIELREYLHRRQPPAPVSNEADWQGLEDLDPVPSMFRVKEGIPAPVLEEPEPRGALARSLPYVAAVLFFALASGVAIHVSTAKPAIEDEPAETPRTIDPKIAGRPASSIATEPQPAMAPKSGVGANNEPWSQTVEVYKRLANGSQEPKNPQENRGDNDRVLGQLKSWMNNAR
jgi:hypothetical protein